MEKTSEDRELEYELTVAAATEGHTEHVQQIATDAASASLAHFENGEYGDLLLNSGRAGLIAGLAALRALSDAGRLLPEGSASVQTWFVMSEDDQIVAGPLEGPAFEEYMLATGLADGEYVDTIRVIRTTIAREATLPQADQTTPAVEAEF